MLHFNCESLKKGTITLCSLNVTKWIHLNQGDEGVKELLVGIKQLLVPGGRLVLQAPAWRSYRKKQNMHKVSRNKLKARWP
jgi:7SK snRNA methylphosphate capping enzyme